MFFLICTDNIVYAKNDDTTMVSLSGGGYVTPSEYLANIHILVGIVLKGLYLLIPNINWLTILYLIGYILSIFVLDLLLIRKTNEYPSLFYAMVSYLIYVLF